MSELNYILLRILRLFVAEKNNYFPAASVSLFSLI
jgi:hypothetical protein